METPVLHQERNTNKKKNKEYNIISLTISELNHLSFMAFPQTTI